MKKFIKSILNGLGIGLGIVIILIGTYQVMSWTINYDGLEAESSDTLTLSKWNELVQKVSGIITDGSGNIITDAGLTTAGMINVGGNKIENVAVPTVDTDVATKAYVDGQVSAAGVVGYIDWNDCEFKTVSNADISCTSGYQMVISGGLIVGVNTIRGFSGTVGMKCCKYITP